VTQLYASNGCLLLTDWLLTMVKVNSVRNRQFVVYDTGIVYIVVAMVVRRSREIRVVRQSCETGCVVSNRMWLVPAHCDFLGNMSRRCAIPRDSPKYFKILRIFLKYYHIIITVGMY
jgi:hypothetical protein